eukprot:16440319-Heterocapsa_arctica.AAC.1
MQTAPPGHDREHRYVFQDGLSGCGRRRRLQLQGAPLLETTEKTNNLAAEMQTDPPGHDREH